LDIDKFNQWLTLVANIGVVAGLVFLAFEVRQNTLAMEREVTISYADNIHGSLADSDHLAPIVTTIMNKEGLPPMLTELMAEYEFTELQAQRWWRFLMQNWFRHQADWVYRGKSSDDCKDETFLMNFKDNQFFIKYSEDLLDPEFVACVRNESP
jgi:hypothetical protein